MADTTALKNRIRAAIKANDNQEITGPVLQQTLLDIVDELDLNSELQEAINTEKEARQSADTQLSNLITGIKNNIDNGYVYAGIATPSTAPVSGKVFYIASAAGTYTNFGGQVLTQGINILRYNGSAWSSQQLISIDNAPIAGSNSLVKSGGVQNELALGAVYDVSAKNPTGGPNNDGKWESLSALLSDANLNTLIPTAYRKGGMSVKYVQSSDNKYVQYRLRTKSFSTEVTNWKSVDSVLEDFGSKLYDTQIAPAIYNTGGSTLAMLETPTYTVTQIDVTDLTEGDVLSVYGYGAAGSQYRLWAVLDANNNITRRAGASIDATINPETLIMNTGECRVIISSVSAGLDVMKGLVLPKWYINEKQKMENEIADLKTDTNKIQNEVEEKIYNTQIAPAIYNTGGSTLAMLETPTYTVTQIDVTDLTEGDVLSVYGYGAAGSQYRLWAVLDANNNITRRAGASIDATINPETLIMNTGECRVIISSVSAGWDVMKGVRISSANIIYPLLGKKVLFIGDSITEQNYYVDRFQDISKSIVINGGLGGTTIAAYDALTNWYKANSFIKRFQNGQFPASADVVVVFGGINDWPRFGSDSLIVPIGNIEDAAVDNTFCGALRLLLEGLKGQYPNSLILMATPLRTYSPNNFPKWSEVSFINNTSAFTYVQKQGKTLDEIRQMMKKIASLYGIAIIDMEECGLSAISDYDRSHYFTDGLHPNDQGAIKIANYFYEKIKGYFINN